MRGRLNKGNKGNRGNKGNKGIKGIRGIGRRGGVEMKWAFVNMWEIHYFR